VCPFGVRFCPRRSLTGGCSFGLQFARAAGAQVIALSSSKEKMDKARALGAHYVINYREVENWEEEVLRIVGFFRATDRVHVLNSESRPTAAVSTT
jgi:NADPH:quinone reductase-like Zn-dependent oxidoreductase